MATPRMSRSHFVLIAAVIRQLPDVTDEQRVMIAQKFSHVLADTNDQFKAAAFLAAATMKDV